MPELQFKGKEFVYNHHLTVPFRPLVPQPEKSIGGDATAGNLVIEGDNLQALKALLPRYAGKVDCIVIDPPYNTGNESWSYNDNVNSPMMREWLSSNPVNKEDMLRHDKWLCMMYPRLRLLYELLSDTGSLWMTLDDNECHHARCILDELFGEQSFVGQLVWQKRTSRENRAALGSNHDYILLYTKPAKEVWKAYRNLLPPTTKGYANPDNDPRGDWRSIPFSAQGYRKNQVYDIETPSGDIVTPPRGRCWGATEPVFKEFLSEGRIYFPKNGSGRPRIKLFRGKEKGLVPSSLWLASEVGNTQESKKELLEIFDDKQPFETPKPRRLIQRIIEIATKPHSIVLDSFAGSGTTAHAVLAQNQRDNGKRQFVLVECMTYVNTLTAERVRRVINGYKFSGVQREELYREKLTTGLLQKAEELMTKLAAIEAREAPRFDEVRLQIKAGNVVLAGEKQVKRRVEGLGGAFTYCTLGEPINLDRLLLGIELPSYEALGSWLFHTATGETFEPAKANAATWYLGDSSALHVWLIYRPDADFLRSREAALTLTIAQEIAKARPEKQHLVFAPAKFAPNKALLPLGVEYAPLPYSLYRVEKA